MGEDEERTRQKVGFICEKNTGGVRVDEERPSWKSNSRDGEGAVCLGDRKANSSPSGFRLTAVETRNEIPGDGLCLGSLGQVRRLALRISFAQTHQRVRVPGQKRRGTWLSTRKSFQNENGDPTAARVIEVTIEPLLSYAPGQTSGMKQTNQISFISVRNQPSINSVQKVLSEYRGE